MNSLLARANTKENTTEMHLNNSKRILSNSYVNNIADSYHAFSLDRIYKK